MILYLSKDKDEGCPEDASNLSIHNFIVRIIKDIWGFIKCHKQVKCAKSYQHND